jgi:hypothetical protein
LVNSNQPVDGIASVSIPAAAAHRAHLTASGQTLVIGRGTFAGLIAGVSTLHLRVAAGVAKKLSKLSHVSLTVHLSLIGPGRRGLSIDAVGHY